MLTDSLVGHSVPWQ